MRLKDLIEALAREIELADPQLGVSLDALAVLDCEDPGFLDALDAYSGHAQRMGQAAELAGFAGLEAVCGHVVENSLLLAAYPRKDRGPLLAFLRAWPPLAVNYLRHLSDPSTAAGLVDHLRGAPSLMDEERAMRVMHMLGAMPQQVAFGDGDSSRRPLVATPEDVALLIPHDIDDTLLEGFTQEAPEQARYLVEVARKLTLGEAGHPDIVSAKRAAHTLKGSGGIMGLRGLVCLSHHLEDILEHLERGDTRVARDAAEAVLDAAYCLEQIVGYVMGTDDCPQQAQTVLQTLLDLANRIDGGDSGEAQADVDSLKLQGCGALAGSAFDSAKAGVGDTAPGGTQAGAAGSPAAMRVSVQRIEELFRVSSEVSIYAAAMEARVQSLTARSRELLAQNLRVQTRLFELETVVDVRPLAATRARADGAAQDGFDSLEMNQYGELHSTAHALIEEAADARTVALHLEEEIAQIASLQARQQRLHKDLQHLVMGTRMTEIGSLESRLQRNVRTTCQSTGKQAVLVLEGGDTMIDSEVSGRMAEPLLHLLRNAVDHGLETPAERLAAGKPAAGRIHLSFTRQGQQVVLRCEDDGRGLDLPAIRRRAIERGLVAADQAASDDEVARMILLPGFSTRDSVSEVSGRGVGLDVVREWAAAMNGSIRIDLQPRQGCAIELRFAASLATVQSLIVDAGAQRFALPTVQVVKAVPRGLGRFEAAGDQVVYHYDKQLHPAYCLADVAGLAAHHPRDWDQFDAVIVRLDEKTFALAVDRLVDARELLVKDPGRYARHVRGVSGLSILGDGGIAVNLDLAQLLAGGLRAGGAVMTRANQSSQSQQRGVLIVDDALTVRNSLLQLAHDAGFRAKAARDGLEAIQTLRGFRPDVVLTDLEMPNMNGIDLTSHIRGRADLQGLPVIMITSRSQDKHRRLAEQAGVNAYITKPYQDADLLQAIRRALAP